MRVSSAMPWQPPRNDRAKSMTLVAGLHLLLGAALLSGLAAGPLQPATKAVKLFNVPLPKAPELPPPPIEARSGARREAGAPDLAAKATRVVARTPVVRLAVRKPIRTSDDRSPDDGAARSTGAASVAGAGRGAGGSGDGTGGGGTGGLGAGEGSGAGSEARLLSGNLNGRDYRRIRGFGAPRGQAVLAIEVGADGRLTRCQPLAGSGNPMLDYELCQLLGRTHWEPARDGNGRPHPVSLRYVATWDRY